MVTGQVTLTGPAGAGGVTVNLASSSAVASVPARVKVPMGAVNAVFSVKTSKVRVTTDVTISATANGLTASTVLTVNP